MVVACVARNAGVWSAARAIQGQGEPLPQRWG